MYKEADGTLSVVHSNFNSECRASPEDGVIELRQATMDQLGNNGARVAIENAKKQHRNTVALASGFIKSIETSSVPSESLSSRSLSHKKIAEGPAAVTSNEENHVDYLSNLEENSEEDNPSPPDTQNRKKARGMA